MDSPLFNDKISNYDFHNDACESAKTIMALRHTLGTSTCETNQLKSQLKHHRLDDISIREDDGIKNMSSELNGLESQDALARLETIEGRDLALSIDLDEELVTTSMENATDNSNAAEIGLMAVRQELTTQSGIDVDEKSKQLRVATLKVFELRHMNEMLKRRNAELAHRLKSHVNVTDKEMKDYENELKAKTDLAELYKGQSGDFQAKNDELLAAVTKLQRLLDERDEKVAKLTQELKRVENSESNSELIRSSEKMMELTQDIIQLRSDVQVLSAEKNVLLAQENLTNVRNSARIQKIQTLEQQNQKYVRSITEHKTANKNLKDENAKISLELSAAERRFEHLQNDHQSLSNVKESLEVEVETLKREVALEKVSNKILKTNLKTMRVSAAERIKTESLMRMDNADCQELRRMTNCRVLIKNHDQRIPNLAMEDFSPVNTNQGSQKTVDESAQPISSFEQRQNRSIKEENATGSSLVSSSATDNFNKRRSGRRARVSLNGLPERIINICDDDDGHDSQFISKKLKQSPFMHDTHRGPEAESSVMMEGVSNYKKVVNSKRNNKRRRSSASSRGESSSRSSSKDECSGKDESSIKVESSSQSRSVVGDEASIFQQSQQNAIFEGNRRSFRLNSLTRLNYKEFS